jgi:hypothetical protein
MNGWLLGTGLFLMFLGAGTSDADLEPYSFAVGAAVSIAGLFLIFLSFEEFRNPKRLARLWMQIKRDYLTW